MFLRAYSTLFNEHFSMNSMYWPLGPGPRPQASWPQASGSQAPSVQMFPNLKIHLGIARQRGSPSPEEDRGGQGRPSSEIDGARFLDVAMSVAVSVLMLVEFACGRPSVLGSRCVVAMCVERVRERERERENNTNADDVLNAQGPDLSGVELAIQVRDVMNTLLYRRLRHMDSMETYVRTT